MSDEQFDFHQPQRQHILGVLVYLVKNFRAMLSLVFVFVAFGRGSATGILIFGLVVLLVFAIILVLTYLQYHNFTFHISGSQLIINSGVFVKNKKVIPFERIQSVHLSENIIQQVLGLVGLKIDTAGSKSEELEIPALQRSVAVALQARLKLEGTNGLREGREGEMDSVEPKPAAEEVVLLRLSIPDLLKVGITENHLRSGFVALAVVYGYAWQYFEYLEEYLRPTVEDYASRIVQMGFLLMLVAIVIFVVASIVISLVKSILKYYGFEARLQEEFVFLKNGLFKKNQYRIPVSKIQFLQWSSNPFRKLLKFKTVRIYQAQSANENDKQSIEIPACYPHQSDLLKQHVFPDLNFTSDLHFKPSAMAYVRFTVLLTIVPVVGVLSFLALQNVHYLWLGLLYLLLMVYVYKRAQKVVVSVSNNIAIVYKGWFFNEETIFPLYKSQSVEFRQPIFLQRRKLAHLVFHTASGSRTVRYLPAQAVWLIYNHAIAQTELSRKSWM